MDQNDFLRKAGSWVNNLLEKYEIFAVALFLLFFFIDFFSDLPVYPFEVALLLFLALSYYMSGYACTKDATQRQIFIQKLSGFGPSMALIGILFRIFNWPGYDIALSGGLIVMALFLIFYLVKRFILSKSGPLSKRVVLRMLILSALCLFFYLVSPEFLKDMALVSPPPEVLP